MGFKKKGTIDGRIGSNGVYYSNEGKCVLELPMHLHEVAITPVIASIIERENIGDPTTMLAQGTVEVDAARTMGAHGKRFSTEACLLVSSLLQARLLGCYPQKRLGKKHAQEGLGAYGCSTQAKAVVPACFTDALRQ